MPEQPKVHVAKVVRRQPGPVTPQQGFDALGQIVSAARECIVTHQVESTKRAHIKAYETTEVARIKAAEAVLKDYFTQVFAERRSNFEELFTRLDDALEAQDGQAVNTVLGSIVDIANSSPLSDLGDLGQIRAALDDPDQVWEL